MDGLRTILELELRLVQEIRRGNRRELIPAARERERQLRIELQREEEREGRGERERDA